MYTKRKLESERTERCNERRGKRAEVREIGKKKRERERRKRAEVR